MTDERLSPEASVAAVAELLAQVPDFASTALEAVENFGSFEGLPVQVSFDDNGRSAHLLAPISYTAPDGAAWPVAAGAWLDGASIPRIFWSLIGGPFEGKYREGSVVHDHYCITRSRTWQATHLMFHDAMRCRGVPKAKAAVMYYAVYRFGPRWTAAGTGEALEAVAETAAAEPFDAASAESFLRDCEAIVRHELGVSAIAALAEVRAQGSAPGGLEGLDAAAAGPSRAQLLVVPGGSGTAEDVMAVAAAAARLPAWAVDHFMARQIRIVACRNAVTDFETHLHNQVPRGWEGLGRTWDSVPGTYLDQKRRVVIGTIDAGGKRVVPGKASGTHGSDDLVVHESLHGYDYSTGHATLAALSFRAARDADLNRLPEYERQAGQAGLEETFAESGAQFLSDRAAMAVALPALSRFWETMPLTAELPAAAPAESVEGGPVGVATRGADGSLVLDLRAIGEGGAIGHATVTIAPKTPEHARLSGRLFPQGLESLAEAPQQVLFYGEDLPGGAR